MRRVLGASSVIVTVAAVAGCFAPTTVYGGSSWYAAQSTVPAMVQEPALIAVSESAPPPMEPIGEWVWTGAGWRWMTSAMVAEPGVPLGGFDAAGKSYTVPNAMLEIDPHAIATEMTTPPSAAPIVVDATEPVGEVIEHDDVRVTVVPLHARRVEP